MLTAADHDLVRRERHIPGLRMALDADALLEHVASRWPRGAATPTHASIGYLRYKPGTSLLAGLTLRRGDGVSNAFVKACGPGSAAKLAKLRASGDEDPVGWGALVDDELRLAVVDATSDRRLPGLRELLVTTTEQVEPLRYKPERRWVGVLGRDGRRDRLVKIHRPDGAAADVGAQHALVAAGLPVPALVETCEPLGLLAYQWIDGVALDTEAPTPTQLAETGALLARLHGTPLDVRPPLPDRAAETAEAVDAIAAALPRCSTVAQSAGFSAYGALRSTEPVTVHGDFSADQVVVRPAGLTLVDLDRVRVDDPAADLASWVAAEVVNGRAPADADPGDVLGPLLDAYQEVTGTDVHDRLDAHTAIALLRRAVDPFRTRAADWPDRMLAVVHAADRLAHRASMR